MKCVPSLLSSMASCTKIKNVDKRIQCNIMERISPSLLIMAHKAKCTMIINIRPASFCRWHLAQAAFRGQIILLYCPILVNKR